MFFSAKWVDMSVRGTNLKAATLDGLGFGFAVNVGYRWRKMNIWINLGMILLKSARKERRKFLQSPQRPVEELSAKNAINLFIGQV